MSRFGKIEFERRVFPRFKLEIPVTYELKDQVPQTAATENISQTGLLVYLPDAVSPGDRLRLKMHLTHPDAPKIIEVSCVVAWTESVVGRNPALYKVGLNFVDVAPEHVKFIEKFENRWLK